MRIPNRLFPALLPLLVAGACARPASPAADPAPSPVAVQTTPAVDSQAELERLYQARLDSSRMRFTPADVSFMRGMIGHHAQAIVMSRLAEPNGASAQVQTLAARIINAQRDEIATMRRWLVDRGQAPPDSAMTAHAAMGHDMGHDMMMPGMLTEQQVSRLAAARGGEFDRLFLTYMIQHHQGAVSMVHALFNTDGAGQDEAVFKFASDVQVDQSTEVARMQLMLKNLTGDGPASP